MFISHLLCLIMHKQRQLHQFKSHTLLDTWFCEKVRCCSSGASNQLLWLTLRAACAPTWHTDRFVMGRRGETCFSRKETSCWQWEVTGHMVRQSLNPCVPVIHQETNFLHFFLRGTISLCTLCNGGSGIDWTTYPVVLFVLNQTVIIERKQHFQLAVHC